MYLGMVVGITEYHNMDRSRNLVTVALQALDDHLEYMRNQAQFLAEKDVAEKDVAEMGPERAWKNGLKGLLTKGYDDGSTPTVGRGQGCDWKEPSITAWREFFGFQFVCRAQPLPTRFLSTPAHPAADGGRRARVNRL
jgi:hypothetical protein